MGQQQTKQLNYNIPNMKMFKLSYCIQNNIEFISEIKEQIDLSLLVNEFKVGIPLQFIYYKLKHAGYVFKEYSIDLQIYRLDELLNYFSNKGIFLSKNAVINDVKIKSKCYESNLNNIYHFLNKGNILLGGIILNEDFITNVLKLDILDYTKTISDIILIVGYNQTHIYLKTNWSNDILKVENKFIKNIREIWNIDLKTFY